MKKLIQIISTVVLSLSLGAGVASAATTTNCNIVNGNGTGSTNVCTLENDVHINFTCDNDVAVNITNDQNANSGNSEGDGNTTVGNVGTGNATNDAAIVAELNASCAKAKTTSTTTTPVTPPAGGQGGGAVQGVSTTKVAALPKTGPSTLVTGIAAIAASAGTLAALVHVALGSYRRRAFKA